VVGASSVDSVQTKLEKRTTNCPVSAGVLQCSGGLLFFGRLSAYAIHPTLSLKTRGVKTRRRKSIFYSENRQSRKRCIDAVAAALFLSVVVNRNKRNRKRNRNVCTQILFYLQTSQAKTINLAISHNFSCRSHASENLSQSRPLSNRSRKSESIFGVENRSRFLLTHVLEVGFDFRLRKFAPVFNPVCLQL